MVYSCFDASKGTYRVFEDANRLPVNADLPVPVIDSAKVGVAAIRAARTMPVGAREVGESWNAKGVVVDCSRRGGETLSGDEGSASDYWPVALAIGLAVVVVLVVR